MGSYEFGSSDVRPRTTKLGLALLALIGAAASILVFWSLRSAEQRAAVLEFEAQAARSTARVKQEWLAVHERFRALEALYASSLEVEEEEFRTFAARCLEHDALRAVVSVVPVVREGGTSRSWLVRYRVGEEAAELPDDLTSEPRFAAALARCVELGDESASAPVPGGEPGAGATGRGTRVLGALPTFNRHRSPVGMVACLWDPRGLLAFDGEVPEHPVWIEDVTASEAEVLVGDPLPATPSNALLASRDLDFGGRWWRISCAPVEGFLARSATWRPWAGLSIGLIVTALGVVTLAAGAGRWRLHQLVASRTAEVRKAYGTLAEEAKERQWAVAETRELERQLRKIIDLAPGMVYVKDWFGRFLLANQATAEAYGTTVEALSASRNVDLNTDVIEPDDGLREERELMESGVPTVVPATSFVDAQGKRHILRVVKIPCALGQLGQVLLCIATDITGHEYAEDILDSQNRILARLARGDDPRQVLAELVRAVEGIVPDMRCSVLLVGDDRRLHHGCAPSLPAFYNDAIDGLAIGAQTGSCGAAAHGGERVVVDDVMTHPNWAGYRDLARRADIQACWSEPIRGTRGEILGTFAMYYSRVRAPQPYEEKLIESMAHLAGLAIERGSLGLVSA